MIKGSCISFFFICVPVLFILAEDRVPRSAPLEGRLLRLIRSPEHNEEYYVTNPSRPLRLPDGNIVMAVREQKKVDLTSKNLVPPGPSQIGLYRSTLKQMNFDTLEFERIKTLITSEDIWFEDPTFAVIDDQILLGLVEVIPQQSAQMRHLLRTVYFEFDPIKKELRQELFRGPLLMKDIRLFALPDGEIGILARPRNSIAVLYEDHGYYGYYGVGHIGFAKAAQLSDISEDLIFQAAKLLTPEEVRPHLPKDYDSFPEFWIGTNDTIVSPDGIVTVYAHIGTNRPGPYSAFRFQFDPKHPKEGAFNIEFLATVKIFGQVPDGEIRANTVFPGGVWAEKDHHILTSGINDSFVGALKVPPPEKMDHSKWKSLTRRLGLLSCAGLLLAF